MIRCLSLLAAAAFATAVVAPVVGASADAPSPQARAAALPTLRLDGIGPLRLGMTSAAALRTGWLANRGRGCELAGDPLPFVFQFRGPRAPAGLVGIATFDGSTRKLTNISFRRGVRTATGVVAGQTTATGMVNRYKDAGFSARAQFFDTFAGTLVTVRRGGKRVVGGFANGRASARRPLATLAIPGVSICD
ncbi:hypothetical protein [Conexibacter sp. CPCC 206217]|uniref:hypothetical protein n=1 Tax=Conexibacter sp. CPCC 206217 TaxID=3064574 RepID=UPI0027237869|nr:hypothetical protein [Conexibacter sp. CPCC 206217]MDO8210624.1 hypothetical protein [Conexibacter sp. CPCC 206217]